jgi:hypothetical protein
MIIYKDKSIRLSPLINKYNPKLISLQIIYKIYINNKIYKAVSDKQVAGENIGKVIKKNQNQIYHKVESIHLKIKIKFKIITSHLGILYLIRKIL